MLVDPCSWLADISGWEDTKDNAAAIIKIKMRESVDYDVRSFERYRTVTVQ